MIKKKKFRVFTATILKELYRGISIVLSPFLRAYFYARCILGKDEFKNVRNHFGKATIKRPQGQLLWIHAVSIGESTSAITFINYIKKQFPDLNVLITTITLTSAKILRPKIAQINNCYHQFGVADNPAWIDKFLDYWNVDVAVFLESEIWPNTICELHKRSIPTFLLNARLSPRSFKRWRLVRTFLEMILQKLTGILAQSEIDRERYAFFSAENTKKIDNLKYANSVLPCDENLLLKFQEICKGKIVFVAASTHEKEEDIILDAHQKLREFFDIITIIIPRHLTRVKRVCEIITKYGFSFGLRSELESYGKLPKEIYCIDTYGEVGTFLRLANICFVGGSLVPIGGHNLYEPVALGKPVLHGPYMENAIEVRDFLKAEGVAFEVHNADEICSIFKQLLQKKNTLECIHKKALQITKNDSLHQIDEIMQLQKYFK